MPQSTVYEVAEKAGVSISTVSRVLNAPDKVNPVTRARVLTVIDELGFVPKAEAAVRARKDLGRIGILAPFFTYPSFVERMRGVAVALADLPYELTIYSVDSSIRRDAYLSSLAVSRRLDGLIVMALPFPDAIAERLTSYQLEAVLIECMRPEFSTIEGDDSAGGRMAAEYLLRQGHSRVGFVGDCDLPDYAIHTSDWRLEGFRAGLAHAGIDLPDLYIALAPHGQEPARWSAHRLFDLPAPPTAIFAASDTQAIGVLRAARDHGLSVPRDVAIMGFDDLDISDYIGLTTVRQPLQESGQVAVELLLARLVSRSRSVQRVRLPLTLMQRDTA
jgi:DNA-binding LacI/PurR family transcriptional regulator